MRPTLLLLALAAPACAGATGAGAADGIGASGSAPSDDSQTFLLQPPAELASGFGSSLVAAQLGEQTRLWVGGTPLLGRAAEFELGSAEAPQLQALNVAHCSSDDGPCFLSVAPAALPRAQAPKGAHELCLVSGAGKRQAWGVIARCADGTEYALPSIYRDNDLLLLSASTHTQPGMFRFATAEDEEPPLFATSDAETGVWYYEPLSQIAQELRFPSDAGVWPLASRTLSVAKVPDVRLIAVGASSVPEYGQGIAGPPVNDKLWLFVWQAGNYPAFVGCLEGAAGFGRALANGPLLQGRATALAVADASAVHVFDGRALSTLPGSRDCLGVAETENLALASFTCPGSESECQASEFGAALAIGDADGDGAADLVVGAPGLSPGGASRAGGVFAFLGSATGLGKTTSARLHTLGQSGDELGRALALPSTGGRRVIAAGAPGSGKVALFY